MPIQLSTAAKSITGSIFHVAHVNRLPLAEVNELARVCFAKVKRTHGPHYSQSCALLRGTDFAVVEYLRELPLVANRLVRDSYACLMACLEWGKYLSKHMIHI